jgi:hypothetical protein
MLLKPNTFTKNPKRGSEIWVRDFLKLKGCSRQAVYDAVHLGKLNAVQKYNSIFILWDKVSKNWTPKPSADKQVE